jgi:crotonobetainyl-CoA:carnitine CoA-transferase CaiB-like acyl-CoA transferase
MHSPLSGIRIIDLSHYWAGPYATVQLAGWGAEVIKVESIQRVDGYRGSAAATGERAWEKGPTYNFINMMKKDITLDLTREDGKKALRDLVRISDVVLENFSARVMGNLGLGYGDLKSVSPSLIMVSMPGFGNDGPWRNFTGFAFNLEQLSGIAHHTGFADGPPCNIGAAADPIMGMHGAFAVFAALEHRRVTGEGQFVDLAHLESLTAFSGPSLLAYQLTGRETMRTGNDEPFAAPHDFFPCKGNDAWVAISVRTEDEWQAFAKAIGWPEWVNEAPFANTLSRYRNKEALGAHIAAWTSQRTQIEAMETLQRTGVAAGAALNAPSLLTNPHLEARGFNQWLERGLIGRQPYPALPFHVQGKPITWQRPAPMLGEHNGYALGELLGKTKAEIERLAAEKVIGSEPLL